MLKFIEITQGDNIALQMNCNVENKIRAFLSDGNYNLCEDIDDNGNNVLHCLAKNSWSDYYELIKSHKDFDKIKNVKNKHNMTPRDIAKSIPHIAGISLFLFYKLIINCGNNLQLCDFNVKKILNDCAIKHMELIEKMNELEDNIIYSIKDMMKYYVKHNIIEILCKMRMGVILCHFGPDKLIDLFNYFIDSLNKTTEKDLIDEIINYDFSALIIKKEHKLQNSLLLDENLSDDDDFIYNNDS